MKKWLSLVALSVVLWLAGCPGEAPINPDPDSGVVHLPDGNVTLLDGGPVPDAGPGDSGSLPEADSGSPYGLDARPANPTCVAPVKPPVTNAPVQLERQFGTVTFNFPMLMLNAPGDSTNVYVMQRGGTILKVPKTATAQAQVSTFGTITVDAQGEGGLLGMAFHPNYATNREIYLSYTVTGPSAAVPMISRISRFKSLDNGATLAAASEEILLTVDQPFTNHKGGMIAFGPKDYLFIGFGDGGSGNDPGNRAQDLTNLLGKFLRIDVSGTDGALKYKIPADNPFAMSATNRKEIYAVGVRNPWRWSFDRDTSELWAGDVGQDFEEEIDKIVLGGNYGWRVREGFHCRGGGFNCPTAGYIDPVVSHLQPEAQSITGGYVYRGTGIPSFFGKYIYGDYVTKLIWVLNYEPATDGGPPRAVPQLIDQGGDNIVSFSQLDDGEVYVLRQGGVIQKFVPMGTPPVDNFPKQLSATGCFEAADPTKPVEGLIPYDLNAALWSDGAQKERFLALPDGQKITVEADGDFTFPNGTVLAKTFSLGGKRVETRLFMRHPDGTWGGFSYEWNDAQTDATLLAGSKTKQVGAQTWYFPSRSDCLVCHTSQAGFSLGLEVGQLNRTFQYPSTARTRNQLTTLEGIGMFSAPLPATRKLYPNPFGGDPVDQRAQAYLHANCAGCHRPGGTGRGPQNFVYGAAGGVATYCNVNPANGNLGVANAKILAPGAPASSIISVRMHALDANRMPPLATQVVDTSGTALVDGWIQGMTACPQ